MDSAAGSQRGRCGRGNWLGCAPARRCSARGYSDEDLGQGETESRYGYEWIDGTRTVLAEEVKNEIFDGATPYTRYLRGVVVDGEHGVILSGSGDDVLLIEG